ncbi:hypothetical protein LSTR_LSTR008344 [Laodelphax striatellus]|uniref:Uncharacterized protein n=1 Tax=Laodelphax striatellus TaxID=195883 RepID=A0A482XJX7_LAOST|nr:hypothetical protein LSTR_LSTR008344 [Laodelphax striatellus]
MRGLLDSNRPVPFRLTPNLMELLTETGVNGPLSASVIASARCFMHPNFKVQTILRAILRDEMIMSYKKKHEPVCENLSEVPGEAIITKAVAAIY